MQYREVTFTFPEEATDLDKVILVLQSPYSFVRWCRTRVGRAPNAIYNCDDGCVVEEYLYDVAGVRAAVESQQIYACNVSWHPIVTPKWVERVIMFVDIITCTTTYHDVANMVMMAIQRGEIA